jgi:Domain of unknown function (DUF4406)
MQAPRDSETFIYIAGPMRNYPQFNFPAFHSTAAKLRRLGWEVFSPAERDEDIHGPDFAKNAKDGALEEVSDTGFSLRRALGDDLWFITQRADAIFLLKGWEKSKGALAEKATAEALGLAVYYES